MKSGSSSWKHLLIANRKISKFEKKTIQESPNLKLLMQIMQSISSLLYVEQIGGMKLKKVTATAFFFWLGWA